jgi:hypothetical protein
MNREVCSPKKGFTLANYATNSNCDLPKDRYVHGHEKNLSQVVDLDVELLNKIQDFSFQCSSGYSSVWRFHNLNKIQLELM